MYKLLAWYRDRLYFLSAGGSWWPVVQNMHEMPHEKYFPTLRAAQLGLAAALQDESAIDDNTTFTRFRIKRV